MGTTVVLRRPQVRVAYHEAGHAVASFFLRHLHGYPLPQMRRVTIVSRPDALGHVQQFPQPSFDPENDRSPRLQLAVQGWIMCCLAGHVAERRQLGRRPSRGTVWQDHDHRAATELAARVTGSADEERLLLLWLRERTENLIALRWSFVELVARTLLDRKTLTGRQVSDVIRADMDAQVNASLPPSLRSDAPVAKGVTA